MAKSEEERMGSTTFTAFKLKVKEQFDTMISERLFVTDIGKDELWDAYLDSFPEGTNKIFRERREYDCQHCKQFIRAAGNIVAVKDNKLVSIWDINIKGHYQVVADELSKLVKSKKIKDVFLHYEKAVGTDYNLQVTESGEMMRWNHFYFKLPKTCIKRKDSIGTELSTVRGKVEVVKRSLEELSVDAAHTILDLISQNSLYRGEEHRAFVDRFVEMKSKYDKIESSIEKDIYCWTTDIIGIRNTVIGSLLIDITDGKDLEVAVKSFESKVAPANYKRPNALITKRMITAAQKKVEELGIESSLPRRFANVNDITINNILFADKSTKKAMNVFDDMVDEVKEDVRSLKKVEEVSINTFIEDVLPKADKIDIFFENSHANNLMSLIAPKNEDSKRIFKWDNNFSWGYNGGVTDSIKERVKKAGGNIGGVLRCSLSWYNFDDLDIHCVEPGGNHIYYGNKANSFTSGVLDVDMNVGGGHSRNAVENITWSNKDRMEEGEYVFYINQYTLREASDLGFEVELEYNGAVYTFSYDKKMPTGVNVEVIRFNYSKKEGIKVINSLPSSQSSKEYWGINTNSFHKVSMVMNSPNHWEGNNSGNKHYFFILESCKNDKPVRGMFNEFLKDDLREHRKVFEVLGSKMIPEKTDNQLSGLGFSTTQRNSLYCKLTGSFTRTIKIKL